MQVEGGGWRVEGVELGAGSGDEQHNSVTTQHNTVTSGYGDTTPSTHAGRTVILLVMFIGVLLVATITAIFIQIITFNRTEADIMLRVDLEQWEHTLAEAAAGVMQANFHLWRAKRSHSSWTADAYNGRVRASDRFRRARDRYASWKLDHPDAIPSLVSASSSPPPSHNTTGNRAKGAEECNGRGRTAGGDVTDGRKEQEMHEDSASVLSAVLGVEAAVAAKVSAAIELGLRPLQEVAEMQEEHYMQMQHVTAHVRSLLHVQQRMVLLQEQTDAQTLALIKGFRDSGTAGSRGEASAQLSDGGAASSSDVLGSGEFVGQQLTHEMEAPRSVSVTLARNPHVSGGRGAVERGALRGGGGGGGDLLLKDALTILTPRSARRLSGKGKKPSVGYKKCPSVALYSITLTPRSARRPSGKRQGIIHHTLYAVL